MKWDNFTIGRIEGFKCALGKNQSIFWDGKTPGLGVRVTTSGAKSFIFETSLNGKTLRITIGDVKTWSIGDAQAKATSFKAQTDTGVDPRRIRADGIAESNARATAMEQQQKLEIEKRELIARDAWAAFLSAPHPKWGAQHRLDHAIAANEGGAKSKIGEKTTKSAPLASLLRLPLSHITAAVVQEWLIAECATRPTFAHNSFRKFRAFVRWCTKQPRFQNIVHADCCLADEVKDIVPSSKTKAGDSLQREQLQAWFDAVCKISSPVISTYLQGLLLTGARREELACLRWDDVDFKWRTLSIRDKVEGSRVIPLTPYLANLLRNLNRINQSQIPKRKKSQNTPESDKQPSEWVFFSKTAASGRIQEPRIAHNKALAAAGLPHVSLHGLRRSFGTLCEWVEVPSGVSAQIMGHKPSALAEKHYRRRPVDLLRKWHDQIEAWIIDQGKVNYVAGN